MKLSHTLTITAAGLVVLGGTYAATHRASVGSHPADAPTVSVVPVRMGQSATSTMAEGVVVPSNVANVNILPSFTARVDKVYVNIGDYVQKGQVLAKLDTADAEDNLAVREAAVDRATAQYSIAQNPYRPEQVMADTLSQQALQQQLEQQQARLSLLKQGVPPQQLARDQDGVDGAQAKLELATSVHARTKTLFDKNLAPRVDLENSEVQMKQAEIGLDAAKQRLDEDNIGPRPEQITMQQQVIARVQTQMKRQTLMHSLMLQGTRQQSLAMSQASLTASKIAAAHQAELISRSFVRAPISGLIVDRNINEGEVAGPSAVRTDTNAPIYNNFKALFVITDDSSVLFQANMDQMFFSHIRVGQPASVYIESMPGRAFLGKVERFNPLINSDAGGANATKPLTFQVWVRIPNPGRKLVSGQTGFIKLKKTVAGLVVPQNAVTSLTLGDGLAYVEKDGAVHVRSVRYDGSVNGQLHVIGGLKAGEDVVVSHAKPLADGMKVTPVAATSADFVRTAH